MTTGDGGDVWGTIVKVAGDGGNIELTTGAPGLGGTNGPKYGNVLLAKNGGKVLIGMTAPDANSSILQVDGTAVSHGWYDWTAAWTGTTKEALSGVVNIKSVDGKIDHKSLPSLAYADLSYYKDVNCVTVTEDIVDANGVVYEDVTHEVCDKVRVEREARSIGGMVTVLVEAVKELNSRVGALEAENRALKEKLGM